jgi:asparagine synthase (glutamine-hydrolysing)
MSALASTAPITDGRALVGHKPTASSMRITEEGLVIERGAAWTAPIYYREHDRVACSELAPLVKDSDTVDPNRLSALVGYAVQRDERRTVYREIAMVRPFETVTFSRAGVTSSFQRLPRVEPIGKRPLGDLAKELRQRLFAAIQGCVGNRRVAVMLSGGLDSSSVLAALIALRGGPRDVCAVTLDFEAPGDDRPHVRALERHFGISVERVRPADVPALQALVLDGAPSRHHGDLWVLACARRAHDLGAEALVTGTGGDGFFGGDLGTAVRCALLERDWRGAWHAFSARFPHRASFRHRARAAAASLLRPHLPQWVRRQRARRIMRAIPEWAGPVLRSELEAAWRARTERASSGSTQERLDDVVRNPADSEYGAEARAQTDSVTPIPRIDPLYDLDLVRFLTSVSQQTLFADGVYRGLLRRAMSGLLPESVRLREDKSDFEPAFADAVRFDDLKELLDFRAIEQVGIVDAKRFRDYLAPLYAAPRDGANGERWLAFWPAVSAEAFLRS